MLVKESRDSKGTVVNEAPVGVQSRAPTKPQRESSPYIPAFTVFSPFSAGRNTPVSTANSIHAPPASQ